MKRLIDIDNMSDIGTIDWEFIHDMQGIAPYMINYNTMTLTKEFLQQIPPKYQKIKEELARHLHRKDKIHLVFSDIENQGSDFKVTGTLINGQSHPLSFCKVEIFDKDRFEDDFIGSVITDKKGSFSLVFGKGVFSDFGLESMPEIYFKIYVWEKEKFVKLNQVMPIPHEVSKTDQHKFLIEFGLIKI